MVTDMWSQCGMTVGRPLRVPGDCGPEITGHQYRFFHVLFFSECRQKRQNSNERDVAVCTCHRSMHVKVCEVSACVSICGEHVAGFYVCVCESTILGADYMRTANTDKQAPWLFEVPQQTAFLLFTGGGGSL